MKIEIKSNVTDLQSAIKNCHTLFTDKNKEVYVLIHNSDGLWEARLIDDSHEAWETPSADAIDAVSGLTPFYGTITVK